MRVLLVANYVPDGQQSMQRYAVWLEQALSARGYQVTVTRPTPYFSRLTSRPGFKKYLGYLDKFLIFPPRLRLLARQHDLVHILDHSNSIYLRAVRGMPNLITCHDVLAIRCARGEFPQIATGWTGRLLQRWILSGLRIAHSVACVSAKTADDLRTLIGAGAHLRIIHNPPYWDYQPAAPLSPAAAARLGLQPGQPYLLHIAGNLWYKNRIGVLRIVARLAQWGDETKKPELSSLRLVLAGHPITPEMRNIIHEEHIEDRVIEAVDPDNELLQALYSNALALLFPSLEEGFGLPIIEAQACGCPVITSNRPPMTEVAGQAAIYIDPLDPAAAASAIAEGLKQREQLRQAGFRNLERFSRQVLADRYCTFYKAIVKGQP